MKIQDKIVLNILEIMKEKNIDEEYLLKHCEIKEKRLKKILDINAERVIRIDEMGMIAQALGVTLDKLFDVRKY